MAAVTDLRTGEQGVPAPKATRRTAALIGIVVGLAAVAVYSTRLFQPFDPDGATNVGWYIHYPGILRIFRTNTAYSNHLLFTLVEKFVYLASGSNRGEAILKVVPIAFAGASVGLLTAVIARSWGVLRGIAVGLVLGTNLMFVSQAAVIRGYSMVVFFALSSSLVLLHMTRVQDPRRRDTIAYVLLAAAGIATHVFMVLVVVLQAAYVLARHRPTARWIKTFASAGALGLLPYIGLAKDMLTDDGLGRRFWLGFPNDLAYYWLGGTGIAVAIAAVLLVVTALTIGWRREWLFVGVPLVAMLGFMWLIWQPFLLGTRFFIWALPAVAVGIVYATRRFPALLLLVGVLIVAQVWVQVGDWYEPLLAEKAAGAITQQELDSGKRVCSVGFGSGPLAGYVEPDAFVEIRPDVVQDLKQCDDVVLLEPYGIPQTMLSALQSRYPHKLRLPAQKDGVIYSMEPIAARGA